VKPADLKAIQAAIDSASSDGKPVEERRTL